MFPRTTREFERRFHRWLGLVWKAPRQPNVPIVRFKYAQHAFHAVNPHHIHGLVCALGAEGWAPISLHHARGRTRDWGRFNHWELYVARRAPMHRHLLRRQRQSMVRFVRRFNATHALATTSYTVRLPTSAFQRARLLPFRLSG